MTRFKIVPSLLTLFVFWSRFPFIRSTILGPDSIDIKNPRFQRFLKRPIASARDPSELVENVLWGFHECSENFKNHLVQGFRDVRTLLGPPSSESDIYQIDWGSPAAMQYFGPTSRSFNRRSLIQGNFQRARELFRPENPRRQIEISCEDPCTKSMTVAYASRRANGEANEFINFCARSEEFWTIDAVLKANRENSDRVIQNPSIWDGIGSLFFHEILHLADIGNVNQEIIDKYQFGGIGDVNFEIHEEGKEPESITAYGDVASRILAYGDLYKTDIPNANSENHKYYLLADFVQKQTGQYPYVGQYQKPWPYSRGLRATLEAFKWKDPVKRLEELVCKLSNRKYILYDESTKQGFIYEPVCKAEATLDDFKSGRKDIRI